jgi:hypothetical protein
MNSVKMSLSEFNLLENMTLGEYYSTIYAIFEINKKEKEEYDKLNKK